MKILVKRNNKLVNLGEGRIYSKSQLRLNEVEDDNTAIGSGDKPFQVDLTNGQDVSSPTDVSRNATAASTKLTTLPNAEGVINIEDAGWTTTPNIAPHEPGADVGITANGKTDKDIKDAVEQAKDVRASRVIVPLKNSVAPRKVMDEMRRNSIPFTKKELSKFLNSL